MNILLLDDDADVRTAIEVALADQHKILSAATYSEAIAILDREEVDGAIIDIKLSDGDRDGTEFLVAFKERYPDKPAIMESGYRDVATVVKCMKLGADDYIEKPFDKDSLNLRLDKALADTQKNRVLQRAFDKSSALNKIVGSSKAVARARDLVDKAQDMRILFYGETGVGKTPFAWWSNRVVSQAQGAERAFEQVNCAALSTEQFQDQLFGHKKGAFTSAIADKRGLVELARGGDLFLDEIGDMALETQAHFLTFLDSMEYYRLGDDKKRKADVRIICATNKDLRLMVKEGKFRQDLYSRISQVVVEIPPLRERAEDIPELFEHFVELFLGHPKAYDEEIISIFKKFRWEEGNVRELRDAVEYLCIMSRNCERINVENLSDRYRPIEGRDGSALNAGLRGLVDLESIYALGLDSFMDHLERSILEKLVHDNVDSLESMAKRLKISRPTLYRRMKKYDISEGRFELLH